MSNEPKWTKGPWKISCWRDGERCRIRIVDGDTPGFLHRILFNPQNWFLEEDLDSEEYQEFLGNCRLIAAAPELYIALAVMAQHHQTSPHIGLARAALAKARGEQS